ncbi:rcsF protein [Colwellia sp. Arc7-635]|jgi:RcsF protein|uniref:Rcs stress response system protein RcsF n=1 Tax=Colwellia sp. Arc7-635 TaxID=2497879 RepID=UPI000F857DC4|nr:Rcs stress response system protein RcsF [Colwellia sp. Arc7-635]AZQ83925.1 rcsF protein [Colwellia sp. Arc7-635]
MSLKTIIKKYTTASMQATRNTSIFIFVAILTTSCAKINDVSTNLDRENFKNYFSPTKVNIVKKEQDFTGKYKFLGLVEGESCQEKAHHALPNEIDARTEARRNAYKLGANAIIFSQCVMIEEDKAAKYCLASTVCYGRAYQVEQAKK